MLREPRAWYPGSYTKNFSWGNTPPGLKRIHEAIRVAFNNKLEDTPRELCRERLERAGFVWHIPLNFFLLNRVVQGESLIVVDELIYQALAFEYDANFDALALVCFNNSYVGVWAQAENWQSTPAPWAFHFILENVAKGSSWDVGKVNANAIETFIENDPRYKAVSARKISTNLNYMYQIGGLARLGTEKIERWWINSAFLILDRCLAERGQFDVDVPVDRLLQYLSTSRFIETSGVGSRNKSLALLPIATLYDATGGLRRWSTDAIQERQALRLAHIQYVANSEDPFFAIYPEDPNVIKAIPRACAMLAKELAGFEEVDADELLNWNVIDYVKRRTRAVLDNLRNRGLRPTMSAADLLKLTRGE